MVNSIPVLWVGTPSQDAFDVWWDVALIKDILTNEMWAPANGYEFVHHNGLKDIEQMTGGGVVVIPARHWVEADAVPRLREALDKMLWRVLIVVGQEEGNFDYRSFQDDRTKVWLMQPKLEDTADFYIGSGYAPHAREMIERHEHEYLTKPLDWFFAGQNNHERREQAASVLQRMVNREDVKGRVVLSDGFTQGITPQEYFYDMAATKTVPCPSGVQSPDSFRVYEALESGAIPVVDDFSTVLVHEPGYWQKVFNEQGVPFKMFNDYANLEGYICDALRDGLAYRNRVFAWWLKYKRYMAYTLCDHISQLISSTSKPDWTDELAKLVNMQLRDKLTVIIPTSPIKSHPSTKIIEQTINSIRSHLPDCEIIITFDGVRGEQEQYRDNYEEYIRKMLWKCNFEYKNVLPLVFTEHLLQVQMARKALEYVKTPLLLYVEHDCTIRVDGSIDWQGIVRCVEDGTANMVRLSHESEVLDVHKHMYFDDVPQVINGIPLLRTSQYSQRPHVASVAFYKRILNDYFSPDAVTMIEDRMYGVVEQAAREDGIPGWNQFRIWLYAPGHDYKRSYTTDGRDGDLKYDDTYIF